MNGEPDNLTPVMLRRLDSKMDVIGLDVRDIRHRLTALEIAVANLAAT